MLIGIISDSHDHVPHIRQAASIFKKHEVDMVLHAGDYCSPFTIPPFDGLPLKGVFGNNDGDRYLLMQKFSEIGAELVGEFAELSVGGQFLALYHGSYAGITQSLVESGRYEVVIHGHTHQAKSKQVGNTLVVNPGSAHGFEEEATIALLDTESLKPSFITLS